MKVLFLDVDGVIYPQGKDEKGCIRRHTNMHVQFEKAFLQRIRTIATRTNAVLVCSSNWSNIETDQDRQSYDNLCRQLAEYDLHFMDATSYSGARMHGREIEMWLCKYKKESETGLIESYCILDDEAEIQSYKELSGHLVLCKSETGVTDKNVYEAIRILNQTGGKNGNH